MKLLSWVNLFHSWVSGKCLKFAKRKVSCSESFSSWCSVHNNVVVNQCPFSVLVFFIFNDDRNFVTLIFSASFHHRSQERVSFSKGALVLFMSEKSMKEMTMDFLFPIFVVVDDCVFALCHFVYSPPTLNSYLNAEPTNQLNRCSFFLWFITPLEKLAFWVRATKPKKRNSLFTIIIVMRLLNQSKFCTALYTHWPPSWCEKF